MKVHELMGIIEIEGHIRFQYYDYDTETHTEISLEKADDKDIRFMWADEGEIVIEVED